MSKRFTDTLKWDKEWFQELNPKLKCLWLYICDNADNAGVWERNFKLASFIIGEKVCEQDFEAFGDRVTILENGKYWIVNFIDFQYGELSKECRPHLKIFESLNKNGIEYHPDQNSVRRSRSGHVSEGKRDTIYHREGGRCLYCLSTEKLEPDHIIPRSKGGSDEIWNLVTSCKKCNALRQNKDIHIFISSNPRKTDIQRVLDTLSLRVAETLQETEKETDKEVDKETDKAIPVADGLSEKIYLAYPRKEGRGEAIKAIQKALKKIEFNDLLDAVTVYAKSHVGWIPSDRQFIPHPATWFNQERWKDDRTLWGNRSNGHKETVQEIRERKKQGEYPESIKPPIFDPTKNGYQ